MAEKKKMKTWLKVLLIVLLVLAAIIAAFIVFITSGLDTLQKAKVGQVDITSVPDGVYTGEYSGNRWANTLQVTVSGGKITDIAVIKDQFVKNKNLSADVFELVIEKQSTDIDAVSGATVSTNGYLLAIEDALKK